MAQLNWGLIQQQPDFANALAKGYETGRNEAMLRQRDNALAAFQTNPDDPTAQNALLGADPQTYTAYMNARETQQKVAGKARLGEAAAGFLGASMGAPAAPAPVEAGMVGGGAPAAPQPPAMPGEEPMQTVTAKPDPRQFLIEIAKQDPDTAMKLFEFSRKADEGQRKQIVEAQDTLAAAAAQLRGVPYEQRKAMLMQMAPMLQQRGVDAAMIEGFDPTDAAIDVVAAQALGVKGLFEQQDRLADNARDQRRIDGQLAVTKRGQDMTDARARAGAPGSAGKPAKALPPGEVTKLATEGETVQAIADLRAGYSPNFSGFGTSLGNFAARMGVNVNNSSGESADWWQRMDQFDNVVRNQLFGASLTAGEQAAWERTTVTPGMAPSRVKANLAERERLLTRSLKRKTDALTAAGYAAEGVAGAVAPKQGAAPATAGGGNVIRYDATGKRID